MIPKYNKAIFREKFRRYRIFFFVCAFLFVLAFVLECVFYGAGGFSALGGKISLESFFSRLAVGEGLFYLALFFFGLTIYAPFFSLLTSFFRGALSGFCLSSVYLGAEGKERVLLLIFTFLYLAASAWLFMGYGSFCAVCALRLYSPSGERHGEEEKRMFGGTLFRSALFCNAVNLRFLFSYFLFFLAAVFFSVLLSFLYSFLRVLV